MSVHRSVTIALMLAAALLASGATLAWAAGIVGGHRLDHIGTFEPISRHLAPAASPLRPGLPGSTDRQPTRDRTTTTTTSPTTTGPTTTGNDNGRRDDD